MDALRTRLVTLGINLNDAANGVWLPGPNAPQDATEAYHRRLNNADYNDAVIASFKGVANQEAAAAILKDVRSQLQNGTFPGVRPRSKP